MSSQSIRIAGVVSFLILLGRPAVAQTNLSEAITLNPPAVPWAYTQFTVTTAGNFNLFTISPVFTPVWGYRNDPEIFLFNGSSSNGAGLGTLIASNRDGGYECGSLDNYYDPCIYRQLLGLGNFTLATGLYFSQESEARNNTYSSGYFDDTQNHDLTVRITSDDGVAINTVPEPASMSLIAGGLVALFGVSRWRRRRAENRTLKS